MTLECRSQALPLANLGTVNAVEHAQLRAGGAADNGFWNSQPAHLQDAYKRFKKEVKDYYRAKQKRRCCYCSKELDPDHSVFDAEHILDKSTHQQFMFELNNLAAACRPCNRAKSAKLPLVTSAPVAAVPAASKDYCIVHPHLDAWDAHLEFDFLRRIKAKPGSSKGKKTIEMCKIHTLNAARLSDHFEAGGDSEGLLRQFFEYRRDSKKRLCLKLLRDLANGFGSQQAAAVVDTLQEEYEAEVAAKKPTKAPQLA